MTKVLKIEQWVMTASYIIVTLEKDERIVLHRKSFEKWADRNFKREFVYPEVPEPEVLNEDSGRCTWEQYYKSDFIDLDMLSYYRSQLIKDAVLADVKAITTPK